MPHDVPVSFAAASRPAPGKMGELSKITTSTDLGSLVLVVDLSGHDDPCRVSYREMNSSDIPKVYNHSLHPAGLSSTHTKATTPTDTPRLHQIPHQPPLNRQNEVLQRPRPCRCLPRDCRPNHHRPSRRPELQRHQLRLRMHRRL